MPDFFDDAEQARVNDAADMMAVNGLSMRDVLVDPDRAAAPDGQMSLATASELFDFDPSQPFQDAKLESFLRAVVEGAAPSRAWQEHISDRCSKLSATQQASKRCKEPRVRARLTWLIKQRSAGGAAGAGGAGGPNQAAAGAAQAAAGGVGAGAGVEQAPMTRAEIEGIYERIARGTSNDAMKMQAAEKLAKMRGLVKDEAETRAPDPAWLCWYLGRCEEKGVDPVAEAAKGAGVA